MPFLRPPSKQIRQLINRRHQQAHSRFKRWFIRCTRMTARRDKDLRPRKRFRQLRALLGRDCLLQFHQVDGFLVVDVLGQIIHEGLDCWDELRVRAVHVLEFFELFLYLVILISAVVYIR